MTDKTTIKKTGIRRKVILIICLSSTMLMVMVIGFGYLIGMNVLRDMVGDVHRKMALALAGQVASIFDEEISRIKGYAEDPRWKEEPPARNSKDASAVTIIADSRLDATVKNDKNITHLAVFDRFGFSFAGSGKTSLLDGPDEEWQKGLFSGKKTGIHIGNIEFDEEQRAWVVPIWLPLYDTGSLAVGIYKADLAVQRLFSLLNDFQVDATGRALLIDGKGNIMLRPGTAATNVKLCSDNDYRRLITSRGKYAVIYDPNARGAKVFTAFSEVMSPLLLDNGKAWRVLINQDIKEVFAPLQSIIEWALPVALILLAVMVAIGFFFSGILVRPIQSLYMAAMQIMNGNWDYSINVKTGDEIEQFADVFRKMITTIKGKQDELVRAKEELEELSKSLEKKVRARTIDLTTARDKLNNYAKELERALTIKSDFISMASHELRTPLTAIREGISVVSEGKAGAVNDQQGKFLEMAKRNVDRLGRLINDILDFQKIEAGKLALKLESHNINDIAKEAADTMRALAKEKGLELIIDLAADIPDIKFDKDKIMQVVTNLATNAIKFTEKGNVTIKTSRNNNIVKLEVRDTGIGIKESDMPKLFQKFSQLEKGLERKAGGSGLGLVISKEIVEKHGGKIGSESKHGEGSSFYFLLPIEERRAS